MDVSTAVARRRSIRGFLPDPVDTAVLHDLLERAARAPSGGNVQPWRIYVVNGQATERLLTFLDEHPIEPAEYDIYPPSLREPYRTSRFAVGEQLYAHLGIEREDRAGRLTQFAKNGQFFGAPAGLFCFVDRVMGPPQWSDLGMFLQTFMLLAQEVGLDTCPQEYWTVRHAAVQEFVGAPENEMLFCGMAIGTADPDHPLFEMWSERRPLDEWATFIES